MRFNSTGSDELANLANGFDHLMGRQQKTINSVAIAAQPIQAGVLQSQDINSVRQL